MRFYRWMMVLCVVPFLLSCSHHDNGYLGYIEGRYVYLSSPVSGQLTQLAVQKGETVSANQLAFQLDPEPELSQLNSAKSDLVLAEKMLARNRELRKTAAIGEATLDASIQQYDSAVARVNRYTWMVSQKTVHIPNSGFVEDTLFRQNEFVPAGRPVISFLPPENRIVVFFIPENKMSQVHPGGKISFTCDQCAKKISATVDYIASRAEYTPPVIYSMNSREKLVFRIEAVIDPAIATKMNPGEPVEVSVLPG